MKKPSPRAKRARKASKLTIEKTASVRFRAWPEPKPTDALVPTNEEWTALSNPHLITMRVAWMLMHQSKADMVEMVAKMFAASEADNDVPALLKDMFLMLNQSKDWFGGWSMLLDSAAARLAIASAAYVEQAERKGGR